MGRRSFQGLSGLHTTIARCADLYRLAWDKNTSFAWLFTPHMFRDFQG